MGQPVGLLDPEPDEPLPGVGLGEERKRICQSSCQCAGLTDGAHGWLFRTRRTGLLVLRHVPHRLRDYPRNGGPPIPSFGHSHNRLRNLHPIAPHQRRLLNRCSQDVERCRHFFRRQEIDTREIFLREPFASLRFVALRRLPLSAIANTRAKSPRRHLARLRVS